MKLKRRIILAGCLTFLLSISSAGNIQAASTAVPDLKTSYISDEILVVLKPHTRSRDRDRLSSLMGTSHFLKRRSDVLHIHLTNGQSVEDAIAAIQKDPAVLTAQPNYRYTACSVTLPSSATDGYFCSSPIPASPCNSVTGTGSADWPLQMINCPSAWTQVSNALNNTAPAPVTVAILDTGCASNYLQTNHPDLPSSLFVPGYNSTSDYGGDTTDTLDNYGHGTIQAGIIAAQWNNAGTPALACPAGTVPPGNFNGGTVGVAGYPGLVKIMPVKVLAGAGYGSTESIIEGTYYAVQNGAKVLNYSLGGGYDALESQAIEYAIAEGCVVAASAGNGGPGTGVEYPGAYPGVIATGALGPGPTVSSYSQTGTGLCLTAPGGTGVNTTNAFDTAQNILGCMTTCQAPTINPRCVLDPCDSNYAVCWGTSQACPFVCGTVCLMWAVNPTLSNTQIVQTLENTCSQFNGPQGGWDPNSGYGCLNAAAAVSQCIVLGPQQPPTATPTLTATPTPVLSSCQGSLPGSAWTTGSTASLSADGAAVYDANDGNGPEPFLVGGAGAGQENIYSSGAWNNVIQPTDGSATPLAGRDHYGVVSFNGSIWVFGGLENGTLLGDSWYALDGQNFVLGTASAFTPRTDFGTLVYNGAMWMLGGKTSGGPVNEVWTSTDGIHWTQVSAASPFTAREGAACVVFNGKMWVIGGENAAGNFNNDCWSSTDGSHWTDSTPTASGAVFSARGYALAAVCGNALWVLGGQCASGPASDVWVSQDGQNWSQSNPGIGVGPVSQYSANAFNYQGQVWLTGSFGQIQANCCLLPTPTATFTSTPTPTVTATPTPRLTATPTGTPVPQVGTPVLYPNPCTGDKVSLNLPNDSQVGELEVQVYTVSCRKIMDTHLDVTPGIDCSLALRDKVDGVLANGIYFIKVTAQGLPNSGTPPKSWILKLLVLR